MGGEELPGQGERSSGSCECASCAGPIARIEESWAVVGQDTSVLSKSTALAEVVIRIVECRDRLFVEGDRLCEVLASVTEVAEVAESVSLQPRMLRGAH